MTQLVLLTRWLDRSSGLIEKEGMSPLKPGLTMGKAPVWKFRIRLTLAVLCAVLFVGGGPAFAGSEWRCPDGFTPREGLNTDFASDGALRAFVVIPPAESRRPIPTWVPLTGTVEATNDNLHVLRSGQNAALANSGFMVIAPVRRCAEQDPDYRGDACNGPGHDGWNWTPWNDGRAPTAEGDRWRNDAGPDARFLEAMVRCVGTRWPLDRRRLYVGGISAGATMTYRALLFGSDFWAGGLPISGEWYVDGEDGRPLSFADAREAVIAAPDGIFQSRVGPSPLPSRLGPMIVITVWGGERDIWYCGAVFCADYRPSTQAASNYFSSQRNVVHVACSANHGHMWPQENTAAFNIWALQTLASHPKRTPASRFRLTPPPEGYRCRVGRFTDHYQ